VAATTRIARVLVVLARTGELISTTRQLSEETWSGATTRIAGLHWLVVAARTQDRGLLRTPSSFFAGGCAASTTNSRWSQIHGSCTEPTLGKPEPLRSRLRPPACRRWQAGRTTLPAAESLPSTGGTNRQRKTSHGRVHQFQSFWGWGVSCHAPSV